MYSLIGLNELGGIVEINDTLFSHFLSCGSVIRYVDQYFSEEQFTYTTGPNAAVFPEIEETFEQSLKEKYSYSGDDSWEYDCGIDKENQCYEITIANTIFEYMEYEKFLFSEQFFGTEYNPLRYNSPIFSLNALPAYISITGCTFRYFSFLSLY